MIEKIKKVINKIISGYNFGRSGFTIMELLVSFTMFTIIVSILTSIFIISNRSQRNIATIILVNDNTYLTIEQIARDIRDGKDFDFDDACFPNCFSFRDRNGHIVTFDHFDHGIRRTDLNLSPPNDQPKKITADNVDVVSFTVLPNNCSTDDSSPPVRLTLNLVVKPLGASDVSGFENHIQTTVSSRNLAGCTI